jgi:NADH dehydrogenase
VHRVEGEVTDIDAAGQIVTVRATTGQQTLLYDRLVFALGSHLLRPNIAGLAEHAFDVDTYVGAAKLDSHLRSLVSLPESPGRFTVVVVGAGLTGLETATEMVDRLRLILNDGERARPSRIILADHRPHVGSDMGDSARPVIEEAIEALGIETRLGINVVAIDQDGVTLDSGEIIQAATVVWCAGMRANPLTRLLPVERDRVGRITVDEFMRVVGAPGIFAAGDVARAMMDDHHVSVMSCQHSRPMGRFAGHNVVCDLFGLPMQPLSIPSYVTVLDLGAWSAVYTQGWERRVVSTGEVAKKTKKIINCDRIYPPLTRDRLAILAAAAPIVQEPPATYR